MPLLLRGLDLPDADIRANVIDTLLAAADSTPESKENAVVSEHAASLVATMLKNCMVKEIPSAVRPPVHRHANEMLIVGGFLAIADICASVPCDLAPPGAV